MFLFNQKVILKNQKPNKSIHVLFCELRILLIQIISYFIFNFVNG